MKKLLILINCLNPPFNLSKIVGPLTPRALAEWAPESSMRCWFAPACWKDLMLASWIKKAWPLEMAVFMVTSFFPKKAP